MSLVCPPFGDLGTPCPQVWDLRKNAVLYRMKGHSDTVTGLTISPDGSYLLSNAMDNSLRIWDIRPFAPSERCIKILTGHQHNFEKVSGQWGWFEAEADGC